jgi:hypothetical protein
VGNDTYRLRHQGTDLQVEVWQDGKHNHARLLADGEEVATGRTDEIGRVDLEPGDGRRARVQWWWKGKVARVALVEEGGPRPVLTPFAPPEGTRAARSYAFQQKHPGLYAARHVALNLAGTIVAILGVGALVRAVLGSLLPRFDIDLPDLNPPDWLKWVDPLYYLRPVWDWVTSWFPDLSFLLDWFDGFGPWVKYVVGFLVACAVAITEYRRRKKQAAEARADGPQDAHGQP